MPGFPLEVAGIMLAVVALRKLVEGNDAERQVLVPVDVGCSSTGPGRVPTARPRAVSWWSGLPDRERRRSSRPRPAGYAVTRPRKAA
ncbi:hypothetical protein ACFYW8_34255 [Streptomyces sp. NPDC002742]|uniref:hypothetical protein n=1 Tax=Streptomyces sp. NPDC002742 TaxID=3364663 RepID=UPI0036B63D4B